MEDADSFLAWWLGDKAVPDAHQLLQMSLRAAIMFLAALIIIRFAHKRFFAKHGAFDVIVAFMLGSTLSRAINGTAAFFESMAAGAIIVVLHWVCSSLSYHSEFLGYLIKGRSEKLIENGKILERSLERTTISRKDLEEGLRLHGKTLDPKTVHLAVLERNGEISVIVKKGKTS